MSNVAIETLVNKKIKLLDEQQKMNEKFDLEIAELIKAIKCLRGEYHDEQNETPYDDESPNYIKGSLEEM